MRIGFLSTVDPNDPDQLSGMPWAMKRQLQRLGAEIVDLVPSSGRRSSIARRIGRKLRRGARRVLGERWVAPDVLTPPAYDDPDRALEAFIDDARRGSREVVAQLAGRELDALFGCCVSTLLYDLHSSIPVVYYSDTTAQLINSSYPEYLAKPRGYHEACDLVERRGLSHATAAVFATRLARGSAIEHYGVDPLSAYVVPMGANVESDGVYSSTSEPPLPQRSDLRLVLTAIDPVRKRTDLAVEATEELVRAGWNARLTIIGNDTPAARSSPHVDSVGFLKMSRRRDLERHRSLLRSAHFMILPSTAEAFGIAPCEAGLEGVPSIVSRAGGLPEVVRHDDTGWVLPVEAGAPAYAEAIARLASDGPRYRAMREAARMRARSEYTWDRWGDRIVRVLDDVLSERSVSGSASSQAGASPRRPSLSVAARLRLRGRGD